MVLFFSSVDVLSEAVTETAGISQSKGGRITSHINTQHYCRTDLYSNPHTNEQLDNLKNNATVIFL